MRLTVDVSLFLSSDGSFIYHQKNISDFFDKHQIIENEQCVAEKKNTYY